jgi:hypothetical protein
VKAVSELERHLNIAEPVLKFLTVVAQAPQRRIGKGKAPATAPQEDGTPDVGTHDVGTRQTGAEVQEA